MIRVMIIDDEILARIGIQTFLEDKSDISVRAVFSSFSDAIQYLENGNPIDIVITDIETPGMNGLEFIRLIRQQNYCAGIIIVSCHDNFAYAREAVELGVDSYILKQEVTEDKLLEILRKIHTEKIVSWKSEKKSGEIQKIEKENMHELMSYSVGVLKIQEKDKAEASLFSGRMDKTMLIHILENIVENSNMGTLFSPYDKEIFILFQFPEPMNEKAKTELLKQYCKSLNQNVQLFIDEYLLIGCSRFFDELNQVGFHYQECMDLLSFDFYEKGQFFIQSEIWFSEELPVYKINTDGFLDNIWIENFTSDLKTYLDICSEKFVKPAILKKDLFNQINHFVYDLARKYNLASQMILEHATQREEILNAACHRSFLEMRLKDELVDLQEKLQNRITDDTLEKILKYIEDHIHEQISLTDVAQKSFMSVPHFCKKFKDYTGETFIKYINIRKVEKIKEYLEHRRHSLNEIASVMGFQNVNYMTRLFKKVTGLTIREYRKNVR